MRHLSLRPVRTTTFYWSGQLSDQAYPVQAGRASAAGPVAALDLDEARQVIVRMGERFGATGLFGREKDEGLEGSLSAVMQTFGGQEVHPSLEERRRTCCTSW